MKKQFKMVYVSYSHRIIIDYHFIKWISEKCDNKSIIISRMLRINQNSKEHKKENILILEEDFNKLCEEGIIKDKDMIRGCVFPFEMNKELLKDITDGDGIKEMLLVRLILGVMITKEKPFQSILLTTKEAKKEYDKFHDFLEKIQNFKIKDEEESLVILNDLYKTYTSERDISR